MREFHKAFAAAVAGPRTESATGALAIYRNTALAGTVDALVANYPVVRALLGDEMFDAVAVDFALGHPPASPVLALYGAAFAEWIGGQDWAVDLPYLADVTRVERLHGEALFAADADPLDPADFAQLALDQWAALHVGLHPATRVTCSSWPAASLWLAHQDGGDLEQVAWQPESILVTRPGCTVLVEPIPAPTHRFLLSLAVGAPVAAAVEATLAAFPDADIAAAFSLLLTRGAFAAMTP
jgi:hypothetical protein